MAKIEELRAVGVKLKEAWAALYAVENDLPEASDEFEMELDEGFEQVQQAVMDVENLLQTIQNILTRNENDQA